jgi:hypothetical protein
LDTVSSSAPKAVKEQVSDMLQIKTATVIISKELASRPLLILISFDLSFTIRGLWVWPVPAPHRAPNLPHNRDFQRTTWYRYLADHEPNDLEFTTFESLL